MAAQPASVLHPLGGILGLLCGRVLDGMLCPIADAVAVRWEALLVDQQYKLGWLVAAAALLVPADAAKELGEGALVG